MAMPDNEGGDSRTNSRPKSVAINLSKSTNKPRNTNSRNPNNRTPSSKGGVTLLGLGSIILLVLFVPVEGPLYACLLPSVLLFAIKDILNIPTKLFLIILVSLVVVIGIQFINAMSSLGMY